MFNHGNLLKLINENLYLLFSIFLFQSCTFVRTVAFFKPDTDDHEQIFSCDTVCHSVSSAKLNLAISNVPFYPIQDWVPAYDRLGANDLNTFMERSQTAGFVVIHQDTVCTSMLKGHELQKQRIVFSVTKAVTCMLVPLA